MSLNWQSRRVIEIDESERFVRYSEPSNVIPEVRTYRKGSGFWRGVLNGCLFYIPILALIVWRWM